MTKPDELSKAKSLAFYYLGRKAYTQKELGEKLQKRFSPSLVKEVLDYLLDLGYLNDQKYTVNYLENKKRARRGPRKIIMDLKKRGVSKENLEQVKELYSSEEEEEIARQLAREKASSGKTAEQIYRFLLGRGFSLSTAGKIAGQYIDRRNNYAGSSHYRNGDSF